MGTRGPCRLEPWHAALRLRSDPAELGRARRFADAAAERFGLSRREREDFSLAANEAVANAIEHGRPCLDGAIHVWTTEQAKTLTLGVRNRGEFIFRLPSADLLAERGRGLNMISDLMDGVALRSVNGHTELELKKERADAGW
jgi:anti-sigma regulatory factor (Ser/Thr protein kinase)